MKRRTLFWKIYPSFVLISFASLLAVAVIACLSFKSFHYKEREFDLEIRAKILRQEFSRLIRSNKYLKIQKQSKKLGDDSNTRITIILPSGKVVGDSKENPEIMDNHRNRPEITDALLSGRGVSIRYGHTLKINSMYFAIPIISKGATIGIIRTSTPLIAIQNTLLNIYYKIAAGFFILILITAISSWWISKALIRPLETMKIQAQKLAKGDFSSRVQLSPSDSLESTSLGEAINEIAIQLNQKIEMMINQKNEQEAVFSSMIEGVIAIGSDEKILRINQAAYDILEISRKNIEGMMIQEVIRNSELQKLVLFSLKQNSPIGQEIIIQRENERFIFVQSAPLLDMRKKKCGVVVVFNDVTQLKQFEKQRKEFVANVSHELRTPLTAIQGFAETLLSSSVLDQEKKNEFLKIIHTHSIRLKGIIEDLLTLSRVEKESERNEIELTEEPIKPTLMSAILICKNRALKRNIKIVLRCPEEIKVKHNSSLIEQAIVNLLDNAIKYSNGDSEIKVSVLVENEGTTVSVEDQGMGIPKEHLQRLFERFYRVDKARSRKLGGTGLGLSIVKHIALAHVGAVDVKSEVNKGSIFSIFLPIQ